MPGHIDTLDSFQICGWALEADNRTPDRVTIYIDDKEVAQIPCNLLRPDLENIGLGTGQGGFKYLFLECIGAANPQKVVVRAQSSGEILPHTVGKEVNWAGTTITLAGSALGTASFGEPVYAADPRSIVPYGKHSCIVSASVLAPRGAVLDVVPSADTEGVAISELESSDVPIANLPDGTPNFSHLRFRVTFMTPPRNRYIAFNVVDLNPNSPDYGKNPINPTACMCVPVGEEWLTPPDVKNYERTCGPVTSEAVDAIIPSFNISGVSIAYQLHSLARKFFAETGPATILDWGIGCGRVAVPLKRGMNPDARVIGVEVDRVNAEWCRQNLRDIPVSTSDFFPPLEIEASSIDMIYGISVMTHLTEGAQYAWLKELWRVLKPGGICVLTTHGEYALLIHNTRDRHVINQLASIGISDIIVDANLGPRLEFKRYYRGTFQLRRQVEEQWSKFLEVIAYYPAGLQVFQDIVVLRKE
jgi:SAM-dependent methyltransferase